jgi:hypothetical protein
MITAWTSRSLIASFVLLGACPSDDPPPAEESSSGPGSTTASTNADTTPQPSSTTIDGTDPDTTTTATTGPDTTGPDDTTGPGSSTSEGSTSEGSTSEGSTSEGSTSEGSTSEGSTSEGSTTGAMTDCTAGDGPVFAVGNNGAVDYVVNGMNDPGITVVRGCSYTFNVNAPGHPFFIKTMPVTGVGNQYNDGVTNNGTQNGVITWDVPAGAPNSLFYICQFHASMTGTITVVDP